MFIIIFSVIFSLSVAEEPVECAYKLTNDLRHLAAPEGTVNEVTGIVGIGAPACQQVLDHYSAYDTPWCACFKVPEVVEVIRADFGDCRLTAEPHSNFSIIHAVNWCDETTDCTEVPYHSVCESKNCVWNLTTSQCTGVNPDRFDSNDIVRSTSADLEVPWVDGCDMLVAAYDQYHGTSCDDQVPEFQRELENTVFYDPDNEIFNVTLRDICGETCWFQDQGSPYFFDREDNCTSHLQCNGNDPDVHDYFCANCAACKEAFPDSTDECGVCHLTKYDANVCIEMPKCTSDKSYDGKCASQTETGVETGNYQCYSDQTTFMYNIESCKLYTQNLDNDDIVRLHACPCHTNDDFQPLDCIFRRSKLYTLKEVQEQCGQPCDQIMSRDACLSAGSVVGSQYDCVWLDRLVKGQCVANPCQGDQAADCSYDSCLRCSTDALGEQSCVVNDQMVGEDCDDENGMTDRDVCKSELYIHDTLGKPFACEGVNVIQRLQEPKKLCKTGMGFSECCNDGEMYVCDETEPGMGILNFTIFAGGHCDNQTVATYYWTMDKNCSNVITTEAQTRNIYFSGNCSNDAGYAFAMECDQEKYLAHLQRVGGEFVVFDDSAADISILLGISLLFIWFS